MPNTVIFDVDGTLVDTNYFHVLAWWRAFGHGGYTVTMADIHRLLGQGSDQLIPSLLGHDDEAVRRAHSNFYSPYLEQLHAFPGARELPREIGRRGPKVVLGVYRDVRHLSEELDRSPIGRLLPR